MPSARYSLILTLFLVGCGPTEYSFETAADIKDLPAVELPPDSTNIHVQMKGSGHVATFKVETAALESWVAQMQADKPKLNTKPKDPHWLEDVPDLLRQETIDLERQTFNLRIGDDEGFSEELLKYTIMRSERGGCITVWHDTSKNHAYMWTVYR